MNCLSLALTSYLALPSRSLTAFIVGPLGLGSPCIRVGVAPSPAVLCVATTAFVRPGRSAFGSLPVLELTRCLCPSWLAPGSARPLVASAAHARVLIEPVTLAPAIAPTETGGSPEFPDYPFVHMPRSQTPVVSRPLALARTGLLPCNHSIRSALGPVARTYPVVHHYTFFGVQ